MSGRRRQIRLRGRLVGGALLVVSLVALCIGVLLIDRIGEQIIDRRQQAVARAARDYFVAFAHEEGLPPLARALDRQERTPNEGSFRYALFSPDGRRLGGAALLTADQLPQAGFTDTVIDEQGAASPWRVLVQPLATGGTLVVYEDLGERTAFRAALSLSAAIALAVAIATVLVVSLAFNRLLYRRADAIAAVAGRIAEGELSVRAPADAGGDVFDRLGGAINVMLDRNEELMGGMRTVTDSLAHDLRSPLTRMKAALVRAADPEANEAARQGAVTEAQDEADRALALTAALLDIARAEAGLSRELFEPLDLAGLLEETAELFEPVIEDAGQTLTIDPHPSLEVRGHALLLRQALGNLLYNAARHAGPGAVVTLGLETAGDRVRLIVADTGRGIPEASRGRVTERFVRLDEARSTPGSGLGLAIAAACAKLHGGALELESNDPGLRVVLEFSGSGRLGA